MKQILFSAFGALIFMSGCAYEEDGAYATDGTDIFTENIRDRVVVDRTPGDPITVDGSTYLVTEVTRSHTISTRGPTYGQRQRERYVEVNVRGRRVRCRPDDDCAALVRRAIAEMNDGGGY